ncbi:MAG: TetR/AcrR family transcriptional regulator [Thermodesulfobacteriota bacterium]
MRDTFKKLPEKKQSQILDAAAHVFARKGYDAANVSAICKKARISNGALYKYFKNKEDLFATTLTRVGELFASMEVQYGAVSKSVYDVLLDILKDVIDVASRHPDYIALYLELGSPSMKHFSQMLSHPLEEPTRDFWVDLVEEGKKRGGDRQETEQPSGGLLDRQPRDDLHVLPCVTPLSQAVRVLSFYRTEGSVEGGKGTIDHSVAQEIVDVRVAGSRRDEPA